VFDNTGQSKRVIGWGRIKPQCVVVTPEGHVACTDKKDRTVKFFTEDGLLMGGWEDAAFGVPSGLALMSNGLFVVTDVERKCGQYPFLYSARISKKLEGGIGIEIRYILNAHLIFKGGYHM